ncbi:MAG TPA: hypothetical protein VHT03_05650 [Rhizomicrobium sp.]|nr:hypothetical protein [Rhizomicrobium sp.]
MKIVLHAGFPKTGSTALQKYLATHRRELEQHGIIYPKFDSKSDKFGSHWILAAAFHDSPEDMHHHVQRRLGTEDVSHRLDAAKKTLRSLLATVDDDSVVLLSHEGFGLRVISKLRETLLGFTDHVQVMAYARNPVELYPSSIQQRLKSLENEIRPPDDWVSNHAERAEDLRGIFGEESSEIQIYSSSTLLNGDVIDDFAHYLFRTTGKQLPISLSRERRNVSHSGPACAILFALRLPIAGAVDKKIFARVRGQLKRFGATRTAPKLEIPREWIAIIAANHADAWNGLVKKTSYSPEQKAAHRLPSVTDRSPLSSEQFQAWLLGSGSQEYTLAFADFCESKERAQDLADMLRRLALHFPNIKTLERAAE